MKRRDFLKSVVAVPLAVQLGLTRLVPMSEVPADELGGLCSCAVHGGPDCICDGIYESSSGSSFPRQKLTGSQRRQITRAVRDGVRMPEIDA